MNAYRDYRYVIISDKTDEQRLSVIFAASFSSWTSTSISYNNNNELYQFNVRQYFN